MNLSDINQITIQQQEESPELFGQVVEARVLALIKTSKNLETDNPIQILASWGFSGHDYQTAAKIILTWEFDPYRNLFAVVVETVGLNS